MNLKWFHPVVWAALFSSLSAHAYEIIEGRLQFNTFGTIAASRISDSKTEIVNGNNESIDDSFSFGHDSKIGLQLESRLTDKLNLFWQGVIVNKDNGDRLLDTKWAYLGYTPADWLTLKLGRFIMPLYQISEQQYVGYSQMWVRPPREIYSVDSQFSNFDTSEGIWATISLPSKSFTSSIDIYVSELERKRTSFEIDVSPIRGLAFSAEKGGFSGRLTYSRLPLDLLFRTRFGALTFEREFEADYDYYSAGFQYSNYPWRAIAEYAKIKSDLSFLPENYGTTLTLGRHFGSVMPYIGYSERNETGDSRSKDQATAMLGIRWDFAPGYAVKSQLDYVSVPSGSRGDFSQRPENDVALFTVAFEWAL